MTSILGVEPPVDKEYKSHFRLHGVGPFQESSPRKPHARACSVPYYSLVFVAEAGFGVLWREKM